MNGQMRVAATLVIWAALTAIISVIAATLITTNTDLNFWGGVFLLIVIGMLVEAATKSTRAVWGVLDADDKDEDEVRLAKAKRTRQARIERLVESLDDDEVYDLEALLLAQHEQGRT